MKWKIDDLEEEVNTYKNKLEKIKTTTPHTTDTPASDVNLGATESTVMLTTETATTATETRVKLEGEAELEEVTEMREKFSELIKQENDKYEGRINEMEVVISALKEDLKSKNVASILEKQQLEEKVVVLSGKLKKLEEGDDAEKTGKFGKFKALAGSKIKALESQIHKLTLVSTFSI